MLDVYEVLDYFSKRHTKAAMGEKNLQRIDTSFNQWFGLYKGTFAQSQEPV